MIFYGVEYYGTEEDLDVIARVGDGFDGKVRNLRVYSTALSDARVQEIFDADKDEFGLAKSSVSVYRGHLGVGTTEPKAALTVMDEVAELEEFPPRAMTAEETYMEGHGVFKASASSHIDDALVGGTWTQAIYPWEAFNKTSTYGWVSTHSVYTVGLADSDSATRFGILGEWLEIEMPSKIKLNHFTLSLSYDGMWGHGTNTSRFPKVFNLYKSNDGVTWTTATEITTPTAPTEGAYGTTYTYNINESEYYNRYLIQVKQTHSHTSGYTGNSSHAAIGEWRLFGTREQGASTLHNGELSLTRNLTVPRIGPALDADDTPRRDRLVVEYNTTTNPTENGVVKDTSGRGFDGRIVGAYYDASEKALAFDGTDDYVMADTIGNAPGPYVHSISVWFRVNALTTNVNVCQIGKGTDRIGKRIRIELLQTTGIISIGINGTNTRFDAGITTGKWYHCVYTYNGGAGGASSTAYTLHVNGVSYTVTAGVNSGTLDLDPDSLLTLGSDHTLGDIDFPGYISNFKIYDVVLTADEIKRLYDMGRCDEGHHVVNFSKTRVGIGLGDGEAPQAALEVRDVARFHQIDLHHDNEKDTVINFRHYDSGGNIKPWEIGQIMGVNPTGANNSDFKFAATNRVVKAWIDSSTSAPTTEINNFTGQHRTFIKDIPFSQAEDLEGLIVSSDQNKYIKMSGGIEVGSNAITTNESLPVVSISNVASDKRCFGVISASEDPETRQDRHGNIFSVFVKEKGDTRVYINSVGEGAIWVVNANGSLESGDYITTSNIAGYGQRQDGAGLMNYTVAKITMDCDFEPVTQPIQRIKQSNVVETHYTGLVQVAKSVPHEFVTTVVSADDAWSNVSVSPSDVTYAEWSNLESNVQNTYTLEYTSTSNVVYDVKYTKTTTANVTAEDAWDAVHVDPPKVTYAEYSNLEANVQNTYSLTFTRTTTEEKTPSEWSALDANAQALWSIQYYDMVEQKVDADYPDAVAHDTVTDKLENDLDEHGQIQWEDTEETEKAYKVRYLDASGQQTDEANAVYRAAFVGCTYHCG
tara:strand:- start:1399 stop:4512 length:3114 start_codon:yes stop_codon:yes gene_type:complete